MDERKKRMVLGSVAAALLAKRASIKVLQDWLAMINCSGVATTGRLLILKITSPRIGCDENMKVDKTGYEKYEKNEYSYVGMLARSW